ncbi:MAG: hypothetical protein KJ072_17905 [Verrucomicrobia bacterium]|nr:hypothetical protein [Verrucomicrobiota bacterium]
MSSHLNLEALSEASLVYVTRLSAATLHSLIAEWTPERQLELDHRQQLVEITQAGNRYVMAGGRWRQQRDQERRQSRIAKVQAELKTLPRT